MVSAWQTRIMPQTCLEIVLKIVLPFPSLERRLHSAFFEGTQAFCKVNLSIPADSDSRCLYTELIRTRNSLKRFEERLLYSHSLSKFMVPWRKGPGGGLPLHWQSTILNSWLFKLDSWSFSPAINPYNYSMFVWSLISNCVERRH